MLSFLYYIVVQLPPGHHLGNVSLVGVSNSKRTLRTDIQ